MITRTIQEKVNQLAGSFPIIALTGPRQSGKTTLAKAIFGESYRYVSLEDLDIRNFATEDPRGFLKEYDDCVIIDEAQIVPELFSYLQGVVDSSKKNGQYVLTGSQHFLLYEKISQSLSGRAAFLHLLPLSLNEIQRSGIEVTSLEEVLFKGFYPRLFDQHIEPQDWYNNYIRTYVERDLRQIKNIHDLGLFQTFLKLCAARTGQILDLTSIGNDCGISHNTVKAWLAILESSFITFSLRPHYKNYGKRLVKSPKLYFYDTGLLCHLLDIRSPEQLSTHYLKGGIFESFVMSELIKKRYNRGLEPNLYFWRDSHGHEVDCLIESGQDMDVMEIKSAQTINSQFFKGINYYRKVAKNPEIKGYLVYGGDESQQRSNASVVSWKSLGEIIQ